MASFSLSFTKDVRNTGLASSSYPMHAGFYDGDSHHHFPSQARAVTDCIILLCSMLRWMVPNLRENQGCHPEFLSLMYLHCLSLLRCQEALSDHISSLSSGWHTFVGSHQYLPLGPRWDGLHHMWHVLWCITVRVGRSWLWRAVGCIYLPFEMPHISLFVHSCVSKTLLSWYGTCMWWGDNPPQQLTCTVEATRETVTWRLRDLIVLRALKNRGSDLMSMVSSHQMSRGSTQWWWIRFG